MPFNNPNEYLEIKFTKKGIRSIKGKTNKGQRGFLKQIELLKNGKERTN